MTADQLEQRIKKAYPDCDVAVIDSTGTSNHFDVRVASIHFAGLTRVRQHQSVMKLFAEELESGELHALAIKTLTK